MSAADRPELETVPGLWIGGRACAGRAPLPLVNPSSGAAERILAAGTAPDIAAAVDGAAEAHATGSWRDLPPLDRQRVLRGAADLLRARAPELAREIARESGLPLGAARYVEVPMAAEALEYFAAACTADRGEVLPFFAAGCPTTQFAYTLREPAGVAGLITPWNFPLLLPTWKVGAALAAGCTAVLKPAPETPTPALRLAAILEEAGLPPGALGVVCGGDALGAALVAETRVARVSLTGSMETGRAAMAAAAPSLQHLTLELGGKSPVIVCADADLDAAVDGTLFGIFFHAGQVCQAGSRILVERAAWEPFRRRFVDRAAGLRVGAAGDGGTDVGPLVSLPQFRRVRAYVDGAASDGAALDLGQVGVPDPAGGFFYPVTVCTDVSPDAPIASEEVFGPVACLWPVDDLNEAVRRANRGPYGLAAGIWTRDLQRALRLVEALQAGTVWVNTAQILSPSAPFGGHKQSGTGRELGRMGLESFRETKTVVMERAERPWTYF
jgi:acyl-CoA reductase-like NAD-dependent aldehyde dehydrogenase